MWRGRGKFSDEGCVTLRLGGHTGLPWKARGQDITAVAPIKCEERVWRAVPDAQSVSLAATSRRQTTPLRDNRITGQPKLTSDGESVTHPRDQLYDDPTLIWSLGDEVGQEPSRALAPDGKVEILNSVKGFSNEEGRAHRRGPISTRHLCLPEVRPRRPDLASCEVRAPAVGPGIGESRHVSSGPARGA